MTQGSGIERWFREMKGAENKVRQTKDVPCERLIAAFLTAHCTFDFEAQTRPCSWSRIENQPRFLLVLHSFLLAEL